jgi:O-antigen ligase
MFALVGIWLLAGIGGKDQRLAKGWTPWLIYGIPLWGIIQIVTHTTASTAETRDAVLRWSALAGVFFLTQLACRTHAAQYQILSVFLGFATLISLLCLTQLATSGGKVLWFIPSGETLVYGTFASHNHYAQFVELALPIALWRGLQGGWQAWLYVPSGGILYSSAIASASRTGSILCTVEVLVMLVVCLVRFRDPQNGWPSRTTGLPLLILPVFAAVLTTAVGWENVWQRLQQNDPFIYRREFTEAAIDMARHRPLIGYGLDTFPEVYQRFAVKSFSTIANHAHDDWAEFAADGGIPFLLLFFIPFAVAVPAAIRYPWGFGLISVMLHACVDYPFPRPAVSGWLFAMLGMLLMAPMHRRASNPLVMKPVPIVRSPPSGVA